MGRAQGGRGEAQQRYAVLAAAGRPLACRAGPTTSKASKKQ